MDITKYFLALWMSVLLASACVIVLAPKPKPNYVNVYIFKETSYGTELITSHNTITDIGEQMLRNLVGFDNVSANNATKWISLGNSTIAAAKTKLDTEATGTGFIRGLAAGVGWVNAGDSAYNYTLKFTATGNIAVNANGCQWSGVSNSDNNLYALASLGGLQSFQNTWNCTIVWVFTHNSN